MVILCYWWATLDLPFKVLKVIWKLPEDDIQLVLKQTNSNFIFYETPSGIHSIKDFSEAVLSMWDHEKTLQFEYHDNAMETNATLTRFGGAVGTLRFDEKSFSNTLIGFTPNWNYKPVYSKDTHFPGVYTSKKNMNSITIHKIQMKIPCIDGSVRNGLRQHILLSFVLIKLTGYKVVCEPQTTDCKKSKIRLFEYYDMFFRRW